MDKEFYIIIVDDNMKPTDAFIMWMKKKVLNAEVVSFRTVEEALSFIFEHLEEKMIIFLDCKFNMGLQGVDGLMKIREKTSLVSVVMMSANSLNQMENLELEAMINSDKLYFIKNGDLKKAEKLVAEIQKKWVSELDCVLEQWVKNHNSEVRSKPYMVTSEGVLSLNDVLVRIRMRTSLGLKLEKQILQVAVDSLTKDIKQNDRCN
ncbi:hypothetical protein [uncultured Prevotella sp.]|uniref:hypothetical protein n=1 Tax=uncultured Prevotella sp. TaxID=159272 RepID=UPI00262FCF6A|nr:hypothetical protein [uncultured Prevotella sp.]